MASNWLNGHTTHAVIVCEAPVKEKHIAVNFPRKLFLVHNVHFKAQLFREIFLFQKF
jgi:hypothetical protein